MEKEPDETPKPWPMLWIFIAILGYVLLQTVALVFVG